MKNKNTKITSILKDVTVGGSIFLGLFLFSLSVVLNTVDLTEKKYYTNDWVVLEDLIFVNRLTQAMNAKILEEEKEEQMAFIEILEDNLFNLSEMEDEVSFEKAIDNIVYNINNPISNEDLAFVNQLETILRTDDELAQAKMIDEFNNKEVSNEDLAFIESIEKALNTETDNSKFLSSWIHAK
jgi:hypothetical protein